MFDFKMYAVVCSLTIAVVWCWLLVFVCGVVSACCYLLFVVVRCVLFVCFVLLCGCCCVMFGFGLFAVVRGLLFVVGCCWSLVVVCCVLYSLFRVLGCCPAVA